MRDLTTLLLVALYCLFNFVLASSGYSFFLILLSPSFQSHQLSSVKEILMGHVKSVSRSASFAQTRSPQMREVGPSLATSKSPAPPTHQAYGPTPSSAPSLRNRGHHHHHYTRPVVLAPSPSEEQSCDQICVEPLTASPYGSPCGCVFPMKVRLLLNMAPYAIFPVMNELEIEVAVGAYLEQSQVKIMGASADSEDQGKTVVEIILVPLGEKFDNTTAVLTADRFGNKKILLNATFFDTYEVISISYPGIPSSPPYLNYNGNSPSTNAGDLPMMANFVNKNQRMNVRTIAIISLSASVALLVLIGAFAIVNRWRRTGRPSSAIDPAFGSSMNRRFGTGPFLSSGIVSSASASLMSTMATCLLSVKKFEYHELEKATEKFSSKRILGEGGFGRVYYGTMEDGTEVAVKLLTRNHRSGDQEFIAEVEMLSRLHHRNLVKLIGICIEGRVRCLVYELIHNGSVESHLHDVDKTERPLDWDARLKIALGAARGLAYLHEDSNPRVIHRDFKSSNVLLEDDFTSKVSDFGLAREATEGSNHISTRVMGTFGYVAPEYAMTGHLLVKSDVYSYGVVLLELLTGRKPVDMCQPQGQENLVTWARPLLTNREGLEQLVDPRLAGSYNIDDMAKVASIASMCVHPEVTNRPFMGEVVQALKLIYNDTNETCGDYSSKKESSVMDSDFKGELAPFDSSWWNAGGVSPRLTYGRVSSFTRMEYSSDPPEELENSPFSASNLAGDPLSVGVHRNRSGPLRTVRSKPAFNRLRGSMSEHCILSRRVCNDGDWV